VRTLRFQGILAAPNLARNFARGSAVLRLLRAHEPFPAVAIDRHWNLMASNGAVEALLEGAAPHLFEGTINVLNFRFDARTRGRSPVR
jgi:MmyB-like transcription regulator ligand binding domain